MNEYEGAACRSRKAKPCRWSMRNAHHQPNGALSLHQFNGSDGRALGSRPHTLLAGTKPQGLRLRLREAASAKQGTGDLCGGGGGENRAWV